MSKVGQRKLFLFSRYSLALLLPKKWLNELGAGKGEMVILELDRRRHRIVLRFNQNSDQLTPVAKPATVRSEKNNSTTDLQPIPEL